MGNEVSNVGGASGVHLNAAEHNPAVTPPELDLLPRPELMQDPMAALEALMVKMNLNDKQHAREAKQLAEQAIQQAVDELVKDMKQQANDQLMAGILGGLGQVVQGGCTIGGNAIGTEDSRPIWDGIGKAAGGAGQGGSLAYQSAATGEDAEITAGNAKRSAGERDANAAQANEQAASDGIRELLARIDRIRQTEQSAQQAALFRV